MPTVLFLCTGNYYRSRFCEAFFNHLAEERGLDWRADSRGLKLELLDADVNPGNIYHVTVSELVKRGIDPTPYESRPPIPAARADFEAADRVFAVKEAEHRGMMQGSFPDLVETVTYWHVHDLDYGTSEEAIPQLEQHVRELIDELG